MTNLAKKIDVAVGDETYTVTRVLENSDGKVDQYSFTTVIDGSEVKLRVELSSETATDLEAQYGIQVVEELTNALVAEFQAEIAKIKEKR
jgi:hypothetical protein